jgi:phage tail sheath gpL-like
MRTTAALFAGASILAIAGCGHASAGQAAEPSGLTGTVMLGPTCPVVLEGQKCDDTNAVSATVTVSEQIPGESYAAGKVVVTTTTDERGVYRISIAPGAYVVTAEAGMSCELMDAPVTADRYTVVDVPCDTGIR